MERYRKTSQSIHHSIRSGGVLFAHGILQRAEDQLLLTRIKVLHC